jgi:hypothetical protein
MKRDDSGAFSGFGMLATLAVFILSFGIGEAAADAGAPGTEAPEPAVQEVSIPLSLDYPLLRKLLLAQVFTGPDGTLDLMGNSSACSDITLSEPALSGREGQLTLLTLMRATIGIGAPGACTTMFDFVGRLAVDGAPEIRRDGRARAGSPRAVRVIDSGDNRVRNDALESLAIAGARSVFDGFEYDLAPQLQSVGDFLPEVLPRHSRAQIESLVQTLRISELDVGPETVDARVSLSIEPVTGAAPPERALTDTELALWEERWQMMDALLVLTVKRYAAATSLQDLRDALLDALIESRYRLRDALAESAGDGRDAVREWFLESWERLAPTIRRIGMEQTGQEQLLLLDVVTAADALEALDQLGPTFGLEISVDGLRRLARMINSGTDAAVLDYSTDLDPVLRKLLDDSLRVKPPASSWRLDLSPFPRAFAAAPDRLNSWAPQREDLPEYLPSVGQLLYGTAEHTIAERDLDDAYHQLFRNLVLATAWQESCWRHYVVSDDRKLVPLRSGTGDVGLMQVNERVWRGFYDQQRLRWDIGYNSEAGAEVLIDYLLKHALRKGEHRQPGGVTNLARASYSAYNGGPSRLARYRSPDASGYGKKVDEAFWEKYQQVAAGNELAVSACLGGNMSGRIGTGRPADGADAANPAQGGSTFVLQLGAFSSEAAANAFIRERSLGSRARVVRRSGPSAAPFLVVYGSYADRAAADAARSQFADLEPWPRRIGDL